MTQFSLIKPLQIGSLHLPVNIVFGPLAGVSDYPYRKMCRLFHQGLIFCEMVKMEAIARSDALSFRMLHYSADMHPIGAQLCGSNPALACMTAKIIEDLGFDIVDLNCGCPVDKVTGDGSGSGLLKTPELIGELVANMVAAVQIPVTLKVRIGWDDDHIIVEDLVRIAELAGAKAITVHGRTRKQGYTGESNAAWICAAKQSARSIKVIGNGDLFSAPSALVMLKETGCDGVLIARGGIGQPWIAEDSIRLEQELTLKDHSPEERRRVLKDHFEETLACSTDHRAILDMRRVGCSYIGRLKGSRHFREAFSKVSSLDEIHSLINAVSLT